VLMPLHEHKSGGEVGESGRGSSAFAGAPALVRSLRRGGGHTRPALRHRHRRSRCAATPPALVVALTEAGYVSHGTDGGGHRGGAGRHPGGVADDEADALSVTALAAAPATGGCPTRRKTFPPLRDGVVPTSSRPTATTCRSGRSRHNSPP